MLTFRGTALKVQMIPSTNQTPPAELHFSLPKITFVGRRTKKRRTKCVAVGPVDKHYPFMRSPLTDKPIIRHSALTSQLFYQSAPPGLLVGRRNGDVLYLYVGENGHIHERGERTAKKTKKLCSGSKRNTKRRSAGVPPRREL